MASASAAASSSSSTPRHIGKVVLPKSKLAPGFRATKGLEKQLQSLRYQLEKLCVACALRNTSIEEVVIDQEENRCIARVLLRTVPVSGERFFSKVVLSAQPVSDRPSTAPAMISNSNNNNNNNNITNGINNMNISSNSINNNSNNGINSTPRMMRITASHNSVHEGNGNDSPCNTTLSAEEITASSRTPPFLTCTEIDSSDEEDDEWSAEFASDPGNNPSSPQMINQV